MIGVANFLQVWRLMVNSALVAVLKFVDTRKLIVIVPLQLLETRQLTSHVVTAQIISKLRTVIALIVGLRKLTLLIKVGGIELV